MILEVTNRTDGTMMVAELGLREELEGILSRSLRALADLAVTERADVAKWQSRANAALQRVERAIELLRQEEQQGAVAKPRFGRAVDWILMVLDSDGRAMTEEEVVQKAMDEGFALGEGSDEYRKGRLTRSLSMYDTGVAGKRKQVLRRKGGRIGRVEWTDDRFEQN